MTTDDRDYLSGRKRLQPDSERNARKRIRDRIRNALYDFEYLTEHLEERDVSQLVEKEDGLNDQLVATAEDIIAFVFRLCSQAADPVEQHPEDLFSGILLGGIKNALGKEQELLDFRFDLEYGSPKQRRQELLRKVHRGDNLTFAEIREAVANEYFDDSFRFRALDEDGLPKALDPEDLRSHDDYA